MTDQSSGKNGPSQPSGGLPSMAAGPTAKTYSRGRSVGVRACPNCGSQVSAQASVCPSCGEGLKDRSGRIRCRHCGERSASELTLCPHCGRELATAPPRVLTWGVPVVLVALFLVLLVRQVDGRNSLFWAQERLSVDGVPAGDAAQRGLVVVVTPAAGSAQDSNADGQPAEEEAQTVDISAGQEADGTDSSLSIVSASDIVSASEVVTEGGTVGEKAPLQFIAAEAEQAATAVEATPAAAEVESTPSAVPPASPPAADAAQGPVVSAASAGAAGTGAMPTLTSTHTPAPESTATPTATATPDVTDTATPKPMPTYQIQRGDTLIVIARKNEVSVEDLMRVNNLSAAQAFTIQPGENLLIPVEGSTGAQDPTSTVTASVQATAVAPATSTPIPTPTTPSLRLDAPILRSPEPGTPMSCSSPGSLAWLPVPFMRAEDQFVLHLGFVSGTMEDGREIVVWVLEQPFPSSAVSWDMDGTLCGLAPQEYRRKWHWFVEVVDEEDGVLRRVSPPSETWHFNWN